MRWTCWQKREAYDPTKHRAARQFTLRLVVASSPRRPRQIVNAMRAAAPAKRMGPGPRP
jgi:hypothetical protein